MSKDRPQFAPVTLDTDSEEDLGREFYECLKKYDDVEIGGYRFDTETRKQVFNVLSIGSLYRVEIWRIADLDQ